MKRILSGVKSDIKSAVNQLGLANKTLLGRIPFVNRVARKAYPGITDGVNPKVDREAATTPDYTALDVADIRKLMNERFASREAYSIACLWDQVRAEELNRRVTEFISPTSEKHILELGCGLGGSAAYISDCSRFVGVELSDEAVAQARESYAARSNYEFFAMDAMNLDLEDSQFDVVIAKEVIEHLPEPQKALNEAFRVLKDGGRLVVTSPNRDSLHLRVNRMLGHADFTCSYDHIREFSYDETCSMVEKAGFKIAETGGVFLQPYWGIPNIDNHVRYFTDNDPQMVEMLRQLGERAGAEYAFCYVIACDRNIAY